MIVSILQLMGFGRAKTLQSPAGENFERPRAAASKQGINRLNEGYPSAEKNSPAGGYSTHAAAAASASRRQEVKAQTPKPKAQKPAAKAKPVAKPGVKAAAKPSKAAGKSAGASAKAPVKVPAKKVPEKAAAKAPAKKTSPPAAKKTAPAPKTKSAPPSASQLPVPKPKTTIKPTPSAAKASPPAEPPKAAPVLSPPTALRQVKPSRLSQITVPSMAQSVASTAAKSSYSQIMSSPVLTPPPLVAVMKDPKLANNWKTKPVDQLSDAEVLAMPDSEYMNEKQMAFFRLKLSQLKQDILNSAGETTEHLREDTVIVPDPADRATIEEEHALELRTRDRERKLLKKIEQSIARIDAGDYGYCDETGEPIGVGRLLARPTATLSLEAQQRRELKQKMFGD